MIIQQFMNLIEHTQFHIQIDERQKIQLYPNSTEVTMIIQKEKNCDYLSLHVVSIFSTI